MQPTLREAERPAHSPRKGDEWIITAFIIASVGSFRFATHIHLGNDSNDCFGLLNYQSTWAAVYSTLPKPSCLLGRRWEEQK